MSDKFPTQPNAAPSEKLSWRTASLAHGFQRLPGSLGIDSFFGLMRRSAAYDMREDRWLVAYELRHGMTHARYRAPPQDLGTDADADAAFGALVDQLTSRGALLT